MGWSTTCPGTCKFAMQKRTELILSLGFGYMAIGETHNKMPVIAWALELLVRLHPNWEIGFLANISDPSFHFPGLLISSSEYSSYMSFIEESIYKTTKTHEHMGLTKPGCKVPKGRKRVACRKTVTGLVCVGLFVGSRSCGYDYSEAFKPWFMTRSILYR